MQTHVEPVHTTLLGSAINFITDRLLVPYANELLDDGFALPSFENLTLSSSNVQLDKDVIFFSGNLDYHN